MPHFPLTKYNQNTKWACKFVRRATLEQIMEMKIIMKHLMGFVEKLSVEKEKKPYFELLSNEGYILSRKFVHDIWLKIYKVQTYSS